MLSCVNCSETHLLHQANKHCLDTFGPRGFLIVCFLLFRLLFRGLAREKHRATDSCSTQCPELTRSSHQAESSKKNVTRNKRHKGTRVFASFILERGTERGTVTYRCPAQLNEKKKEDTARVKEKKIRKLSCSQFSWASPVPIVLFNRFRGWNSPWEGGHGAPSRTQVSNLWQRFHKR